MVHTSLASRQQLSKFTLVWSSDSHQMFKRFRGWSGGAKVSCILRHRGVQLILAYNWARPVTLVAGKGRGGMFYFFCFFTFILVRLSYLSLSFISSTISSISFLPFSGRRHKMTHKGWRVVKPQHNQSINQKVQLSWLLYSCCPSLLSSGIHSDSHQMFRWFIFPCLLDSSCLSLLVWYSEKPSNG